MKLETFFDNFELLAEAPNGVQRLRELILQLAVRGKLVPWDANDEPASVLLNKIKAEKEQLIKEKKIKKMKPLQPIEANEVPYEKSESWVWCRLGEIIQISSGDFLPSDKMTKGGHIPVFGGNGITGYHDQYNVTKPTLVIGRVGFYCGSVHITPELAWITDNAFSTYFLESYIDLKFLYWLLKGTDLSVRDNATAQPVISGTKIYPIIVGLPPLKEQKRIVAKIDQFMSLCDELEARQQKRRESRARLNSAALDQLLAARAPDEFAQGWRRISENFDLLYDAPENVGALKQAILQLAVMGKLVAQDANDEQTVALLEEIKAEKESLLKDKKIRKVESLPPIDTEDMPYELPKGWEWIRLGQVAKSLRYGTSKNCSYGSDGAPVLRIPNLVGGKIDTDDLKFTRLSEQELEDLALIKGDILIVRSNGSKSLVGRSAVVSSDMNGYAYAGYLVRLRVFLSQIYPDYLHLALETSFVREQIEVPIRTTSGVKNINSTEISRLVMPLPPFKTQKRIVAKVNQLMSLCDNLEAGLARSQADGERLMEAVVGNMLVAEG